MRSILISTVAIVGLLAVPAVASAHDDGWYVRGNAGAGAYSDGELSGNVVGDVQAEANVAGSLGLGYDFGNNWRVEADTLSMWNALGNIDNVGGTKADLRSNALMLNALYDFDDFGRFKPYIGAGLGLVNSGLNTHSNPTVNGTGVANPTCVDGGGVAFGITCDVQHWDTTLGYQGIAGLGYEISDKLDWDTQYRYINGGTADFDGSTVSPHNDISTSYEDVAAHVLMTGLRYKLGHGHAAPKAAMLPPVPQTPVFVQEPAQTVAPVQPAIAQATTYSCWDGAIVYDLAQCAAQPVVEPVQTYSCWDNSVVYDLAQCPAVPQQTAALNNCGPSPIAIFDVDLTSSPKPLSRLGTMPEFGDSHTLSPNQFYEKLQARYAANQNGDRPYLNYLFKSMGYSNGFADAEGYMFSDDTLPVGTTGIIGIGASHHYAYHVVPTNERDRDAFRIQSANGTVVHFLKTCGNYIYACN